MKRWMTLLIVFGLSSCADKDSTDPDADTGSASSGGTEETGGAEDTGTDCEETQLYYEDSDGDGYGGEVSTEACEAPEGFVEASGDCDDGNSDVNPGAEEICDESGEDEDCDGQVNGADDSVTGTQIFYADVDGDGFGDPEEPWESCYEIEGYVSNSNDCDDSDAAIGPSDELLGCYQCDAMVPTDHSSIQEAVNGASAGNLICVESGTYTENVDFDGQDVWILGVDGPGSTVIDGNGAGSVVRMESITGSGAGLQGFTITGGEGTAGAGIYISESAPVLADLVVGGNRCGTDAGAACEGIGIYAESASLTLRGVEVRENQGYFDGWIGFDQSKGAGIYLSSSNVSADGLWVADNSIEPHSDIKAWGVGVWGTGLYATATVADIDNARFTGNSATGTFDDWEESYLIGSAIYLDDGSDFTLNHVLIAGNKLDSLSFYTCVGPLMVSESILSMTHGIVSHNVSKCGDVNAGIAYGDRSTLSFEHVNFVANENLASGGSGGIYISQGSLNLTHSVFQDNTGNGSAVYGQPTSYSIEHCNFADSASDSFSSISSPVGSDGNIHAASGFLDYGAGGWADWDFHLSTSSNLIDAGSGTDPDGSTTDIGGFGGAGADGWDLDWDGSPSWWQPGSYDSSYTKAGLDCEDMDPDLSADSGC